MRHNDAHHNNSLVQICTQWNLDRNPFIYIPCVPEGTKHHCIAEVLPLFFCNADILDENSVMTSSGISILSLRVVLWQPAGKIWGELGSHCVQTVWVGLFADTCPTSWWESGIQFLPARWSVHLLYGVSIPAFVSVWLKKAEQGITVLPYNCTSCGLRK